jgi:glycosyltransferase involved in cell wall biosynthesis
MSETISNKPIHVVHVIANSSSVPYFNWLAERVGKYPEVKFSFVCMYPEKPKMLEDMKERGCDCYWVSYDSKSRRKSLTMAFFSLYKLFRKLKPDAIHTHLFDDSLPALLAAKLNGIKIRAITKGDTGFHWYYVPKWIKADRFNNANATHIIALSEEAKQFIIEKEGAEPGKVCIIHHGIPVDDVRKQKEEYKAELRKKFGLEGKIVIGTISRYIEWKGYRYIIEAANMIKEAHPDFKFVFVGYGRQQNELQELVKKYGLEQQIVFANWIDRDHIPSLYGIMDIFLHAAILEPFGLVLIEAMANEVPMVTTRTGVAGDALKHKETCYFIEKKDPKSIVEGIEWMLKNKEAKEAMRAKLIEIARGRFTTERMLSDYINLYKLALK